MPKAKEVVEPALAAEIPPAPSAAPEAPKARVATFWSAEPRKIKLEAGTVEFKTNKLTITDGQLIDQLLAMCGDKHRIWQLK
jgi:hypothetical protein